MTLILSTKVKNNQETNEQIIHILLIEAIILKTYQVTNTLVDMKISKYELPRIVLLNHVIATHNKRLIPRTQIIG